MKLLSDILLVFASICSAYMAYKCLIAILKSWEASDLERQGKELKRKILEGKE